MVPSPTPYGLLFSEIGGSQLPPKTSITIISETGNAMPTDFKFGRYIHCDSHSPSEQNPIKNLGEKGAWAYQWTAKKRIQGLPIFWGTPYYFENG